MNDLGIGKILSGDRPRDAIHVAVIPQQATRDLLPGESVDGLGVVDPFLIGRVEPGQWYWLFMHPGSVGNLRHEWIHPSFPLSTPVLSNQWVYWRTPTVRSIAETIWTDPGPTGATGNKLPILADALEDAGCIDHRVLTACRMKHRNHPEVIQILGKLIGGSLEESVTWIEGFANKLDMTFPRLMKAAMGLQEYGEHEYDNTETYKNIDCDLWPTFWEHYTNLTGNSIGDTTSHPFTCSC